MTHHSLKLILSICFFAHMFVTYTNETATMATRMPRNPSRGLPLKVNEPRAWQDEIIVLRPNRSQIRFNRKTGELNVKDSKNNNITAPQKDVNDAILLILQSDNMKLTNKEKELLLKHHCAS